MYWQGTCALTTAYLYAGTCHIKFKENRMSKFVMKGTIGINAIGQPYIDIKDPEDQERFLKEFTGKGGIKVIFEIITEETLQLKTEEHVKIGGWKKPETALTVSEVPK